MTDEELRDLAVAELESTTISYPTWRKRVENGYKGKPYDPAKTSWGRAFAVLEQIGSEPAPAPSNRYTDLDFAAGKYDGEGISSVFVSASSDPRVSDWGGLPPDLYDSRGCTQDPNTRVHLTHDVGTPRPPSTWASWHELRTTDGPWTASVPNLAKSSFNLTQAATLGPGGWQMGMTRWFAFDIFFPLNVGGTSYEFPFAWNVLGDLHSQGGDADPGLTEVFPSGNNHPKWYAFGTTPNTQTTPYFTVNLLQLTNANGTRVTSSYNVWHEVVMGLKLAADSSGWFEVWFNGVQRQPQTFRATVAPSESGPYFQLQNYTAYPTNYVGGATRSAIVYGGFRGGLARSDVQQT